jgi:hypothetical protein
MSIIGIFTLIVSAIKAMIGVVRGLIAFIAVMIKVVRWVCGFAVGLVDGSKTYISVAMTIISGVGLIATKSYSEGLSLIMQASAFLFGGAAIASLRSAIAKLEGDGAPKTS